MKKFEKAIRGGNVYFKREEIKLTGLRTAKWYPPKLRRIEAIVEGDGKMEKMIFIRNNLDWAAK